MEPVEYVAPSGATQLVEDETVAVRLTAAGWQALPDLETRAGYDQAAAAQLQRAVEVHQEKQARAADRAEAAVDGPPADADGERKPKPDRGPRVPKPRGKTA